MATYEIHFKQVSVGFIKIEDCASAEQAEAWFKKHYARTAHQHESLIHQADELDDFESHVTIAAVNEVPEAYVPPAVREVAS